MSEAELNFCVIPQISPRQKWPKNFLESEGRVEVTGPPQPVLLRRLLAIFKRELEAREIAWAPPVNGNQSLPPKPLNKNKKDPGTTFSLFNGNANGPTCTYCKGKHP